MICFSWEKKHISNGSDLAGENDINTSIKNWKYEKLP